MIYLLQKLVRGHIATYNFSLQVGYLEVEIGPLRAA